MGFWKNRNVRAWVWGVLAGGILLGIGAVQGQLSVIWQKAAMICLECIGIG